MRKWTLALAVLAAGATLMGQGQCNIEPPVPPMDVTGSYLGTWQGESEDETQEVAACVLTMDLEQDTTAPYPGSHAVTGTVTVNYECIELPDWLATPPPSEVQVSGLIQDNGRLVLASGGCGTGACVVLALEGPAEDLDGDGYMDRYSGDWAYRILLAGVPPFGFDGTFTVDAVTP